MEEPPFTRKTKFEVYGEKMIEKEVKQGGIPYCVVGLFCFLKVFTISAKPDRPVCLAVSTSTYFSTTVKPVGQKHSWLRVLAVPRQESEGEVNGLTCRIESGSIYSYQDARR